MTGEVILQAYIPFAEITEMPPVHSEVLEDERPIREWLQVGAGDVVVSIASAGDNVFHLALDEPAKVYGVDISRAQISYCQIKSAALSSLSDAEFTGLMGTWPGSCPTRGELLSRALRLANADFPAGEARSLAEDEGLLHIGRFDQLIGVVRDQIHQAVGADIVRAVIQQPSRQSRARIWAEEDISRSLSPLFHEFFDEDVLDGVFTPRQHRTLFSCSPFPDHLLKVVRLLVLDGEPGQNYYLHRWALGGYLPGGPVPPYLDPANRLALRRNLPRIEWVPAGLPELLHELPPSSVRCFNLSNILDWYDDDYAQETWEAVTRASSRHARVFVRSFLHERAHQSLAARLGWTRNQAAECACLASERVGYYPTYELWSQDA